MAKRFLLTLSTAITMLFVVIVFSSCLSRGTHEHEFSDWTVIKEETCAEAGLKIATCRTCGETQEELIPALEHTPVIDEAISATCTSEGKTQGSHCGVCNKDIVIQESIPKKEHNIVIDEAVLPTCEDDGFSEGSHCATCNTILKEQTRIEATGHEYDDGYIIKKATCSETGDKEYTCTVEGCGYSYVGTYVAPTYSASEIYNQAINYVGEITTYDINGNEIGLATGFVISEDGEIVTNYHVIDGAYSAKIQIGENSYNIISVLAYDVEIDIAILKINTSDTLSVATVCDKAVATGETVYAIGSSRGLTNTYSQGIITQADRVIDTITYIQHDASITNGNSGGPLINVYGEVIGINTWGIADSQNLNFAIFASELSKLVYDEPISLAELYLMNNDSAYNILLNWLLENYTGSDGELVYFEEETEEAIYSLSYDTESGCLFLDASYYFADDAEAYFGIDLSGDSNQYMYYACFTDGVYENEMGGYIYAESFTESSILTYEYIYGGMWDDEILLEQYSLFAVDLVSWFDFMTVYYETDVYIHEFGFEVFEITSTENTAYDILADDIMARGTYNGDTETYTVSISYDASGQTGVFMIVYDAKNDEILVFFECYASSPTQWGTSTGIRLVDTVNGYEYVGMFIISDPSVGVISNTTEGHINPATFTESTILTYDTYEGMETQESDVINTYMVSLCGLLDSLSEYLVAAELDLTLADLGFTSYQ